MGTVKGLQVGMPTSAPARSGKARAAQTAHVCAPAAPGPRWPRSMGEAMLVHQLQTLLDWEAGGVAAQSPVALYDFYPR